MRWRSRAGELYLHFVHHDSVESGRWAGREGRGGLSVRCPAWRARHLSDSGALNFQWKWRPLRSISCKGICGEYCIGGFLVENRKIEKSWPTEKKTGNGNT